MANESILVVASISPNPGAEAAVEAILRDMVAPTRAEPGNLLYDLYRGGSVDGSERSFHLLEMYKDGAALDAHRASDHYKKYRAAIAEYLAKAIDVAVLHAIDAQLALKQPG